MVRIRVRSKARVRKLGREVILNLTSSVIPQGCHVIYKQTRLCNIGHLIHLYH